MGPVGSPAFRLSEEDPLKPGLPTAWTPNVRCGDSYGLPLILEPKPMFVVKCPKCDKRSKAFVDHAGRRGKCPHCGRKIRIVAEIGASPSEDLPDLVPPSSSATVKRVERAQIPDTSPPAVPLALVALGATWLVFALGEAWLAGTLFEPAWRLLLTCRWIGKIEVFMFLWGALLLVWKAALWLLQRRPLGWAVLPERFAGESRVRPSEVDSCLRYVGGLVRRPRRSILLNRVCLALEHLRQTRRVQEVRGALTGQSAIDANMLDSSYSMLRFLIWVIPILGFIGTVLGIGIAVAEFADFIPKVSEIEKAMDSLRKGLGQVTSGLGTAFNTTLVALCLVAPLMLATSWLRKAEEHLLAEVDHFTNHHLLGALDDSADEAQADRERK